MVGHTVTWRHNWSRWHSACPLGWWIQMGRLARANVWSSTKAIFARWEGGGGGRDEIKFYTGKHSTPGASVYVYQSGRNIIEAIFQSFATSVTSSWDNYPEGTACVIFSRHPAPPVLRPSPLSPLSPVPLPHAPRPSPTVTTVR